MRRELAALYQMEESEMGRHIHRITLEHTMPTFNRPLMLAGGGHDMITPGEESLRIFDAAHCERELVFYPRGAHECFNVLSDLRPRMVGWLSRQLAKHRATIPARPKRAAPPPRDPAWLAAEAVDPDFADELRGESHALDWHAPLERPALAARFRWPWAQDHHLEVVHRTVV
jgi:hypothetical protein